MRRKSCGLVVTLLVAQFLLVLLSVAQEYGWTYCGASRLDFVQVVGKREDAVAKEDTLSAEILVGRSRLLLRGVEINSQTARNFFIAFPVALHAAEDIVVALGLLVLFPAGRNAA